MSAIVVVNRATVRSRPSGPATGDVWLALGGGAFPSEGWNDFVFLVVGQMSEAVCVLHRRAAARKVVHFFEGPFMVEFLAGDDGLLVVNAYGGPGRGTLLLSDEMEFQRFAENLLQVGGDLLGACKEASDSSSDQDSFESSLHRLALEFGLFDPAEGD